MALCTLLLVALIGQTVYYSTGSGGPELAGQDGPAVAGTRLVIVFEPAASVETISQILARADALIVGGPRAGGLFEVVVRDRDADTLDARIEALGRDPSVRLLRRLQDGGTQ